MKNSIQRVSVLIMACAMVFLAGCGASGPTIITDTDHKVNVLTSLSDTKPLSVLVRRALKKNGQTVVSTIKVSQDSEDTVKLSGFVNDDAVRQEAERVAYSVDGVRFVVNNLNLRN
ncbi:MAG: BON domain-containing protein [Granulosicoccus sp.]